MQDVESEIMQIAEMEMRYLYHLEMSNLFAMQLRAMLSQVSPEAMQQPGMRRLKQKLCLH